MAVTLECIPSTRCRDITTIALAGNGSPVRVTGRITGPDEAPAVVVLGGISSGRNVTDHEGEPGWWAAQAGPARAIDTDRRRILSFDFIGEALSPFPTTQDQARAILALADAAGIDRFDIIGSSYGGMIGLALAALAPARVGKLLVISGAHRPCAMAQAWRSIQRETVELALRLGDGAAGLDLARRLAMTTYRTPDELEDRFYAPDPDSRDACGIAGYLEARGRDYAQTVSPQRFLALSWSMDAHDVDPAGIACPVTYLAVLEDRLVPASQIAEAAGRTPDGRLKTLHSRYGHDAFLKEETAIADTITDFLRS
ncbi:homoserine O-succinyltransferase [Maricaulis sp.]|uniref:homoserine O-succinyltransferase MetX n=1 Tax=Maricaulis sp. TaxID=1486257 RepID=UPI001AFD2F3F|nr:homoserine O-succinyltransferase [Maricaulis sp.]MBO6764669.1 homoserine O-succinyltransferase [Maricaulis sp.]